MDHHRIQSTRGITTTFAISPNLSWFSCKLFQCWHCQNIFWMIVLSPLFNDWLLFNEIPENHCAKVFYREDCKSTTGLTLLAPSLIMSFHVNFFLGVLSWLLNCLKNTAGAAWGAVTCEENKYLCGNPVISKWLSVWQTGGWLSGPYLQM